MGDSADKKDEIIERLELEKKRLIDANESQRKDFDALEAQIHGHDDEIKRHEDKVTASKRREDDTRNAAAGIQIDLNRVVAELKEAQDEIKSLNKQLDDKDAAAVKEREKLANVQAKLKAEEAAGDDLRKDVPGLRSLLGEAKQERDGLQNTVVELQLRITQLEDVETDLATQKTVTSILTTQIEQQRKEMSRFDLNPQAFRTTTKDENGAPKPPVSPSGNLAEELEEKPNTSDEESSETDEEPSTPPSPPPPPGPSRIIRIIERIPTYYPYHVSDHSQLYCSFMTFVNAWVLINLWSREAYSRVSPTVRRLLRLGPPRSQPPPPPTDEGDGKKPDPKLKSPPVEAPSEEGSNIKSINTPSNKNSTSKDSKPHGKNTGSKKTSSHEGKPSSDKDRRSSEASQKSMDSAEVTMFQGPPSNQAAGNWTQDRRSPHTSDISHMNQNTASGGPDDNDDDAEGPQTPRTEASEVARLLDPVPSPKKDAREKLELGSKHRRESGPPGPHSPGLNPPRGSLRYSTPEEVEALFPLPPGAAGPVDNYIVNTPPTPPSIWQLLTHPDPSQRPDPWRTLRDVLLHLIFFFACYMMWVIYLERQNWKEANNIARAFFDDLFQHRCHYGRGFMVRILPEHWAVGFDRLWLYISQLFGAELKTYPMPG